MLTNAFVDTGDHPKTAEAIARKINLVLGDTRETLAKKTGRSMEEIYEDEVTAIVVHGDDIDGLQGWQWDQSSYHPFISSIFLTIRLLL
jgi:magnesium-transporting ATPase (P-type)